MKPKIRRILEDCIEAGVARGYRQAHKHVENPSQESIIEAIEESIFSELYEYFTFDSDE